MFHGFMLSHLTLKEKKCSDEIRIDVQIVIDFALVH